MQSRRGKLSVAEGISLTQEKIAQRSSLIQSRRIETARAEFLNLRIQHRRNGAAVVQMKFTAGIFEP